MEGAELLDVSMTCLGRLAVAAACGAVVGWEREFHEKRAGLRTHMLITVGACLFALVGVQISKDFPHADPLRLIQGVAIGVGFISGGVIFTRGGSVMGLTTATGLWLLTGVGLAAGFGYHVLAVLATLLGFVIIAALKQTDAWLHGKAGRTRSEPPDTPEIS